MDGERGDSSEETEVMEERKSEVESEVDGVMKEVGFRDKVKHIKGNDQLREKKMMWVDD